MKKIISATEARKNFYKLLRAAGKPGARVTITLENEKPVVMLSEEELDEWIETIEVMSDPELMAAIKESEASSELIPWEDVKKELGL